MFDSGFGTKGRESAISVLAYIREENLFPFALWVVVVVVAVVVVVLNISSTALCLLNLLTKPFRTSQGRLHYYYGKLARMSTVEVFYDCLPSVFRFLSATDDGMYKHYENSGSTSLRNIQ